MNVLNLPSITAAIATSVWDKRVLLAAPRNLFVQANFVYGSGGTTFDAYLQTTVDGGLTWIDVAQFHFTTASARVLYNLNGQTPITNQYTPTDGTLANNFCRDGILGSQFRVKYGSTGTYAGTSISIDIVTDQAS